MNYKEKLLDPRWQKKRLEILQRDDFACKKCRDKTSTLHVHHRRYLQGCEPWDVPNNVLVTLCEDCHEYEKEEMEEYLPSLIEQIKDSFFATDVFNLSNAFYLLNKEPIKDRYSSKIISEAIEYLFGNEAAVAHLLEEYTKMIENLNNNENF